MKKLSLLVFILFFTKNASASIESYNVYNHTFGVDIFKSNFAFKENYGKKVFGKNLSGFNVFGQYGLPNDFFIEYGYEYMRSKDKNTLNRGDHYPGDVNRTFPFFVKFNSKIKQQFPYLGLGYNYKLSQAYNTYLSFFGGINIVRVNGSFEILGNELRDFTASEIYNSRKTFDKIKPSVVLKVAVNHEFSNYWGIRLIGTWRKLNHFKLKSKTEDSMAEIRLKNCSSVGLGVFYNL